jgi:hypothetical protein
MSARPPAYVALIPINNIYKYICSLARKRLCFEFRVEGGGQGTGLRVKVLGRRLRVEGGGYRYRSMGIK